MTQIDYILLCHAWNEQLPRLVDRLSSPRVRFWIHVNRRSPEAEFDRIREALGARPRVTFLTRQALHWGGIGHVRSSLEGIYELSRQGVKTDFVSLMTGGDYPIQPPAAIESFLGRHKGKNFTEVTPIPSPTAWPAENGGLDRIAYWHLRKPGRGGVAFRDHIAFPRRDSFQRPGLRQLWNATVGWWPLRRRFPHGFTPYGGSCYWTLSGEAVPVIVDVLTRRPDLYEFFKRAHVPDELFYQTILMNSDLKHTVVNDDLRTIVWERRATGGPPAFLDASDLPALQASGDLWARKFHEGRTPGILDQVDQLLRTEAPPSP